MFDQAITKHGMLKCIRDYEVVGYLTGLDFECEVQYIFKGCIRVSYKVKVKPEHYSMDDRLLNLDKMEEDPDFPAGFIWGVNHAVVFPGWTIEQDTSELKVLEKIYGICFFNLYIETNAYDLTLTFHDVETKELKRIDKKKNNQP